jgi:predicted transcriptional regulator
MSQLGQEKERVYIGAQVDRGQRDELIRLARRRDRSVSSIIRRALAAELEREPNPERGTVL